MQNPPEDYWGILLKANPSLAATLREKASGCLMRAGHLIEEKQ